VFTHLSERALRAALAAIRPQIQSNGVLCITIRPVEYWGAAHSAKGAEWIRAREVAHARDGFEFIPHEHVAVDVTYGLTSMTTEWLAAAATGWKVVAVDRSSEDPMQRYVFLAPN
jgi:hypothetical protein